MTFLFPFISQLLLHWPAGCHFVDLDLLDLEREVEVEDRPLVAVRSVLDSNILKSHFHGKRFVDSSNPAIFIIFFSRQQSSRRSKLRGGSCFNDNSVEN